MQITRPNSNREPRFLRMSNFSFIWVTIALATGVLACIFPVIPLTVSFFGLLGFCALLIVSHVEWGFLLTCGMTPLFLLIRSRAIDVPLYATFCDLLYLAVFIKSISLVVAWVGHRAKDRSVAIVICCLGLYVAYVALQGIFYSDSILKYLVILRASALPLIILPAFLIQSSRSSQLRLRSLIAALIGFSFVSCFALLNHFKVISLTASDQPALAIGIYGEGDDRTTEPRQRSIGPYANITRLNSLMGGAHGSVAALLMALAMCSYHLAIYRFRMLKRWLLLLTGTTLSLTALASLSVSIVLPFILALLLIFLLRGRSLLLVLPVAAAVVLYLLTTSVAIDADNDSITPIDYVSSTFTVIAEHLENENWQSYILGKGPFITTHNYASAPESQSRVTDIGILRIVQDNGIIAFLPILVILCICSYKLTFPSVGEIKKAKWGYGLLFLTATLVIHTIPITTPPFDMIWSLGLIGILTADQAAINTGRIIPS
jgi:hypothetical protein